MVADFCMVITLSAAATMLIHFIPQESETGVLSAIYKFLFIISYEISLIMFGHMFAAFFKNFRVGKVSAMKCKHTMYCT